MLKIWEPQQYLKELERRSNLQAEAEERVAAILERVRLGGDQALAEITAELDRVSVEPGALEVQKDEIDEAERLVDADFRAALEKAIRNVLDFHRPQLPVSWFQARQDGTVLGQLVNPVGRAGIYVPGGTAPLVSCLVMTVIPARVAGVPEILMCTPPGTEGRLDPHLLVAARECGVNRVFRIGGAQAIAAMAYGTASVPKVDKIAGPGNIYVTLAKKQVYGVVGIDMLAGPSEIAILAGEGANPRWIAADLLSQAEHDVNAASVLITASRELASRVMAEIEQQLSDLPRSAIARKSLQDNGALIIVRDENEGVDIINSIAPEHLELEVDDPWSLLGRIRNAGAIFMGSHTPEPMGDYLAGPSNVLPTGGTARYASGVGVETFLKRSSVIAYNRAGFAADAPLAVKLAEVEGLKAHARALRVRLRTRSDQEREDQR